MACALLSLNACARPVGDFGRAEPSVLHDQMLPIAGQGVARVRKAPLSTLNLSDAEQNMRDRFWRYLTAPHDRDWFFNTKSELERTHLIATVQKDFDRTRYTSFLRAMPVDSSAARFGRLQSHIKTDTLALPAAFEAMCAVIKADGKRLRQAEEAGGRNSLGHQLKRRISENRRLIEQFTQAIILRALSYDHALTVMSIETPDVRAKAVAKDLKALNYWVRQAEKRAYCKTPQSRLDDKQIKLLPSRYSKPGYGGFDTPKTSK